MKKPLKSTTKTKSLLKQASSPSYEHNLGRSMRITNPRFENWANKQGFSTRQIDGMSKTQLSKLFKDYLKADR